MVDEKPAVRRPLLLPFDFLLLPSTLRFNRDDRAERHGVEEFSDRIVLKRDATPRPVRRSPAAVYEDFAAERRVPRRTLSARDGTQDALVLRARD